MAIAERSDCERFSERVCRGHQVEQSDCEMRIDASFSLTKGVIIVAIVVAALYSGRLPNKLDARGTLQVTVSAQSIR